ncbi:hypothetical protein [Salinicoccus roseus]|uniref:hypothetical protein n=1 Tax=Salinicoccus roseus TaxID=45670 RepID=UPI002301323F|nr:hypothetical protein [Salinicoccus roseus]
MQGNELKNLKRIEDHKVLAALQNPAERIIQQSEAEGVTTVLFTSDDDPFGSLIAATAIAQIFIGYNKRVLLFSMIPGSLSPLQEKYELDGHRGFMKVAGSSDYLSRAIYTTEGDGFDIAGVEEVEEEPYLDMLERYDLESRMPPLENYYDHILIVGPAKESSMVYPHIYKVAEAVVLISRNSTSDYRRLNILIDEHSRHNLHNFGIIRRES